MKLKTPETTFRRAKSKTADPRKMGNGGYTAMWICWRKNFTHLKFYLKTRTVPSWLLTSVSFLEMLYKIPSTGQLKEQKCILLQLRRPGVQVGAAGRAVCPGGSRRDPAGSWLFALSDLAQPYCHFCLCFPVLMCLQGWVLLFNLDTNPGFLTSSS